MANLGGHCFLPYGLNVTHVLGDAKKRIVELLSIIICPISFSEDNDDYT